MMGDGMKELKDGHDLGNRDYMVEAGGELLFRVKTLNVKRLSLR